MKYFLLVVILIVVFYLMLQGTRCIIAVREGKKRLETYKSKNIELSYGNMSYVDCGSGDVILSIHGIFGGYDQAYDTCSDFSEKYRILAPSRFGYLGSDTMGSGTPKEQARAYVELLDALAVLTQAIFPAWVAYVFLRAVIVDCIVMIILANTTCRK